MKLRLVKGFVLGMAVVSVLGLGACAGTDTAETNQGGYETESEAGKKESKKDKKKEPGVLKSKTETKYDKYVTYFEYDKNGYEITYKSYDKEYDSVSTHVERVYDENGNLLKEVPVVSQHTSDFPMGYEYDEHGNVTSQFHYSEDGEKSRVLREYVYEYDEHDNLVSEATIENEKEAYKYTTEITYDEKGRKIFAVKRNGDGEKLNEFEWSYYENDAVKQYTEKWCSGEWKIITTDYDEAGRAIKVTNKQDIQEWEYNPEGLLMSQKNYNDETGSYRESIYTYNEKGQILLSQYVSERGAEPYDVDQYEYDKDGKLVKKTYFTTRGFVNYYTTYEYDKNDNLIKECNQDDDGIMSVIEYTYYE